MTRIIDLLRTSTALNYKFGLIAKVRFNELGDLAVLFRELLLLAPNSFVRVASAFAEGGAETKLGVIRRKFSTEALTHKPVLPISNDRIIHEEGIDYSLG